MKRYWIITIALLIATIDAFPKANIDQSFGEANNYYKSGVYDAAIERYNGILNSGYDSPELFYNLGNAYYKTGNYPKAILAYERAKKLAPADAEINFNLALANGKIIDKIPSIEPFFLYKWLANVRDIFSSDAWATIFIISLFIASVAAIFRIFVPKNSRKHKALGIFATSILIIGVANIAIGIFRLKAETARDEAIVMIPTVELKTSLDPAAETAFSIHEGTKVQILEFKDNYYHIKLTDGRQGWIATSEVEVV